MKLHREKVVENKMLGQGQSQQMTLDRNAMTHLMQVLTNLYSDPELAVIREYTTNAMDSHIAAGKKDVPIEVTLPSVFEPKFVVKDCGVGLSKQEVFDVFGSYGASTKRDTNEQVGALGLGCKSALTYTKQFVLKTIKDGRKHVFAVHLDEFGIGNITELSSAATDEGNGVVIEIPVKDTNSFIYKAKTFFRFFDFPVIFHNEPSSFRAHEDSVQQRIRLNPDKDDNLELIIPKQAYKTDYLVMGGVGYPIDTYKSNVQTFVDGTLVIRAPIGAVSFTPSREALQYDELTINYIRTQYHEARKSYTARVLEQVENAPNLREAWNLINATRRDLVDVKDVFYKGVHLVRGGYMHHLSAAGDTDIVTLTNRETRYGFTRHNKHYKEKAFTILPQEYDEDTLLIVEYGKEVLTPHDRGIIRQYAEENNFNDIIVKVNNASYHPEIEKILPQDNALSFDDIKTVVLEKRKQARIASEPLDKVNVTYPYLFDPSNTRLRVKVNGTLPIVYSTVEKHPLIPVSQMIGGIDTDVLHVYVSERRLNKFLKLFPNAIPFAEDVKNRLKKAAASLTEEELDDIAFYRFRTGADFDDRDLHEVENKLRLNAYYGKAKYVDMLEDKDFAKFLLKLNQTPFLNKKLSTLEQKMDDLGGGLGGESALTTYSSSNDKIVEDKVRKLHNTWTAYRKQYPMLFERFHEAEYWVEYVNKVSKEERKE